MITGRDRLICYTVESCPLTKLNGGLSRLHSADEDAVSWLTSYGSWNAYEKKKKVIENSAVRQIIYDFLLVGHCKYIMLYHFQVIWRWIIMISKRSLKVIQIATIRKLWCGFLFAFHSNYGRILNRLWDTQRQRIENLENWVKDCSISLKTAPFDRPLTTFYSSCIVNIALSCTVFELFDVE